MFIPELKKGQISWKLQQEMKRNRKPNCLKLSILIQCWYLFKFELWVATNLCLSWPYPNKNVSSLKWYKYISLVSINWRLTFVHLLNCLPRAVIKTAVSYRSHSICILAVVFTVFYRINRYRPWLGCWLLQCSVTVDCTRRRHRGFCFVQKSTQLRLNFSYLWVPFGSSSMHHTMKHLIVEYII